MTPLAEDENQTLVAREAPWRFDETGDISRGVTDDSARKHFNTAQTLREICQNSLDALDQGKNAPVHMEFSVIQVKGTDFNARDLREHMLACAEATRNYAPHADYVKAAEILRHPEISVLKITDRNTSGLTTDKWAALVDEAGRPAKDSPYAGGSFGTGKNAVLNLSALRTVVYSTLHMGKDGRSGRVEWMKGRTVLCNHGPWRHEGAWGLGFKAEPFVTTQIPDVFRLTHQGTGVYALGFQPYGHWQQDMIEAVCDSFFCAVHERKLTVTIEGIRIDHDNIDQYLRPGSHVRFYLQALRQDGSQTASHPPLGKLQVHVGSAADAPNRVAYVNTMGMLITESKWVKKSNPFHVRLALQAAAGFVAVVRAPQGDRFLRYMENPSHSELSLDNLRRHPQGQEHLEAMQKVLGPLRQEIKQIVENALDVEVSAAVSPLHELGLQLELWSTEQEGNVLLNSREQSGIQAPDPQYETRGRRERKGKRRGRTTDDPPTLATTEDGDGDGRLPALRPIRSDEMRSRCLYVGPRTRRVFLNASQSMTVRLVLAGETRSDSDAVRIESAELEQGQAELRANADGTLHICPIPPDTGTLNNENNLVFCIQVDDDLEQRAVELKATVDPPA